MATVWALDRLGRSAFTSQDVRQALIVWQTTAARPRGSLGGPHDDWAEYVGPDARDLLEAALCALPPRQAAPLRAAVHRADELFLAKTLHNPAADPGRPWWARRFSH